MIRARTVSIFTLGLLVSLAARRDAMATPARCDQYPVQWSPVDGAQTVAQAELASLSPGGNLVWNDTTGTLSLALSLALPLPDCVDGQDVSAPVFEAFAKHPALFQLDLTEWRIPEPLDCRFVGNGVSLSMGRHSLAGQPVARDVFVYSLSRIGGVVQLSSVNGTYLPIASAAIRDRMTACNNLTESTAATSARNTALKATVFSQCRRMGTVAYTPKPNDVFRLLSDQAWTWQEDAGQVLLNGQQTLRVIVNPANYTPELLASAARCPMPGGNGIDFSVGFDIILDVHTGAILSVKPGIDCIVC
jgi:hypothetical protein